MKPLMFFFSLTIIKITIGGVFANKFSLANRRDKEYAIPVVIGAIIEVVLAALLDRPYGASGATVAILITEFVVLILRLWIVRDDYSFKNAFSDVPKYFLIGIITLIAGMLMPNLIRSSFVNMAVKSILMLIIYAGIMFMMKLDFNQDIMDFITRFLRKVKR